MRPPSLDRWVALQCFRYGVMGRDTRATLESRVGAGMQVADVGANQGVFTLLLSRLVGASGRVTAFEPDPRMVAALSANLEANRVANVTLIPAAADSSAGEHTLFRAPHNAGDNRLAQGNLPSSCERTQVRSVRLDDVIAGHRLDFIKIDTQGWEMNVLDGATECLRASPGLSVLFEFWPFGLRQAGRQPADLLALLFDRGFDLQTLTGDAVTPADVSPLIARLARRRYTNLLALRRAPGSRAATA